MMRVDEFKPLYCGFYTAGRYVREANECRASLDAFELPHCFIEVPDTGDWCRNCAQKPAAIAKIRERNPGRPLVYIDVDARIMRPPSFDEFCDTDIACYYLDGKELVSATIFLNATPRADGVLHEWMTRCQKFPNEWDQRTLQQILYERAQTGDTDLKVGYLPPRLCALFDAGRCDITSAAIMQYQVSRRTKQNVPYAAMVE